MIDERDLGSNAKAKIRVDFVIKVYSFDEETGEFKFTVKPDPRRYREENLEGKKSIIDKYLGITIPDEILHDSLSEEIEGAPSYFIPPNIESSAEYSKNRKLAIKSELKNGVYIPPQEMPQRHRKLEISPEGKDLSFISLDVCNSTNERMRDPKAFDKAYEVLFRELATCVGQFHGNILKPTGDGFIAYLDYEAWNLQCDNTIDLGLSMLEVLNKSVNPELATKNLPELRVRIGADYGAAHKRGISVPAIGYEELRNCQ